MCSKSATLQQTQSPGSHLTSHPDTSYNRDWHHSSLCLRRPMISACSDPQESCHPQANRAKTTSFETIIALIIGYHAMTLAMGSPLITNYKPTLNLHICRPLKVLSLLRYWAKRWDVEALGIKGLMLPTFALFSLVNSSRLSAPSGECFACQKQEGEETFVPRMLTQKVVHI